MLIIFPHIFQSTHCSHSSDKNNSFSMFRIIANFSSPIHQVQDSESYQILRTWPLVVAAKLFSGSSREANTPSFSATSIYALSNFSTNFPSGGPQATTSPICWITSDWTKKSVCAKNFHHFIFPDSVILTKQSTGWVKESLSLDKSSWILNPYQGSVSSRLICINRLLIADQEGNLIQNLC